MAHLPRLRRSTAPAIGARIAGSLCITALLCSASLAEGTGTSGATVTPVAPSASTATAQPVATSDPATPAPAPSKPAEVAPTAAADDSAADETAVENAADVETQPAPATATAESAAPASEAAASASPVDSAKSPEPEAQPTATVEAVKTEPASMATSSAEEAAPADTTAASTSTSATPTASEPASTSETTAATQQPAATPEPAADAETTTTAAPAPTATPPAPPASATTATTGAQPASPKVPEAAKPAIVDAAKDSAPATPATPTEPAPVEVVRPAPVKVPEPPKTITIATWSGAYGDAQQKAVLAPFTAETGITIQTVDHKGGSRLAAAQSSDAAPAWDIANVPMHVARAACKNGTAARLDAAKLDAGKPSLDRTDFIAGAIGDCTVASSVWSSLVAYDSAKFTGRMPETLADMFDVETFPGKRALPRQPRYVLEMALMADGVEPAWVYSQLDSEAGLTRAFAKLDKIRADIIWWRDASEPAALLKSGKVTMAAGFNGRFFLETAGRETPVRLLWDGQIFSMDAWVIPQATTHMPTALRFLALASSRDAMVRQASLLPYGPPRKSAADAVARHADFDIDLTRYVPTTTANFARALELDDGWWARNEARVEERFRGWLSQVPGENGG